MTLCRAELLANFYEDTFNEGAVEIDKFVEDLKKQALQSEVTLFLTQADVDNKETTIESLQSEPTFHSNTSTVTDQKFLPARSSFNTYMTLEGRSHLKARWIKEDSEVIPKVIQIMLKTRAYGKSVEEFFKMFGTRVGSQTLLSETQMLKGLVILDADFAAD